MIPEWLSGAEVSALPGGIPRQTLDNIAKRGRIERRQRAMGKGWEYHVPTLLPLLSAEARADLERQYGDGRAQPETASPAPSGKVLAFPGRVQEPSPAQELTMMVSEPTQEEPQPRPTPGPIPGLDELQQWASARALRLTLKDLASPSVQARIAVARAVECAAWGLKEETITALAAQHGRSPMTIRRWVEDVAGWRVQSRVPQIQMLDTSIDLPASKSFDQAAVADGIRIYAGNLKRGMKAAYSDLCANARKEGWSIGEYSSFTRLLGKVPPRIWEYIRKGETGFELGAAPKIIRAWLSVPAYSVLCGDQNVTDYEVSRASARDLGLNIDVVDSVTGEIHSPELYLWMDCTSRAWTGLWPAWGHYNKYTVGYSLREACRIATPGEIYTDWGKPERSSHTGKIVQGLDGHVGCGDWGDYAARYAEVDGVDAEISHRLTARVGIPWAKPIENQMNIIKRGLLDRDVPGFRQRQHGEWENDTAQARLKRERNGGKLLTDEAFLEVLRDVAEFHNTQPCSIKETGGQIIPAEVLARGLRSQSRTVYDDLTLDLLFLPRVTRVPEQSIVRVMVAPGDLRRYQAHELSHFRRGERVQVSFDPFDPERPAVLTSINGDYIGLAEPWDLQQPGDDQGLSDKIKRQRELMKWWKTQVTRIRGTLGDLPAVPRIAASTQIAKRAAESSQAKPDKGASKRADAKLIEMYGGGKAPA